MARKIPRVVVDTSFVIKESSGNMNHSYFTDAARYLKGLSVEQVRLIVPIAEEVERLVKCKVQKTTGFISQGIDAFRSLTRTQLNVEEQNKRDYSILEGEIYQTKKTPRFSRAKTMITPQDISVVGYALLQTKEHPVIFAVSDPLVIDLVQVIQMHLRTQFVSKGYLWDDITIAKRPDEVTYALQRLED